MMKMFLYLIVLFSLSTAIVELHASESADMQVEQKLSQMEVALEKKQIAHMLNLLEKSGRLEKEEVINAKRSLASIEGDELRDFKFQVRDLVNQ